MTEASSWWGWGMSLAQTVADTVQEKGAEILNVYKEDITEFTAVVSEDAQTLVKQVTEALPELDPENKDSGLSQIVNQGSSMVSLGLSTLTQGLSVVGEFAEQQINSLEDWMEADEIFTRETFESEPPDPEFLEWKKSFDWVSKKQEISAILANSPEIMEIYKELVPAQIPSKDFWERYFFKLKKSTEEERNKEQLLDRPQTLEPGELDDWGDLDASVSALTITEEKPKETETKPAEPSTCSAPVVKETPAEEEKKNETTPEEKPKPAPAAAAVSVPDAADQIFDGLETDLSTGLTQAAAGTSVEVPKGAENAEDDWMNWG